MNVHQRNFLRGFLFEKLCFAVSVFLIFSSVLSAHDIPVRVGFHHDTYLVITNEQGVISGFGVELINGIAEKEGWECEYYVESVPDCLTKIRKGELDIVLPLFMTEDRKQWLDFSKEAVISAWGRIFTRPGQKIESILDLNGKTIAVGRQNVFNERLRELLKQFDFQCRFVEFDSTEDIFNAMLRGYVDIAATESIKGQKCADKYNMYVTPIVFSPGRSFVVAIKGGHKDLLGALDKHLLEMKKNPSSDYYKLYDKWLTHVAVHAFPAWARYLFIVFTGLSLILVFFSIALRAQVRKKTRELKFQNIKLSKEMVQREASEKKRNDLEEQLVRSQKMEGIGRFAAGIVHDFNNVIQGIRGYSELVLETLDENSPVKGDILEIKKAGDRATELIKKLLMFSRSQPLMIESVDINELITRFLEMIKRIIGGKHELYFVPEKKIPFIRADTGQIEQVLTNLCVNARDAMPKGGEIIIKTYTLALPGDEVFAQLPRKFESYVVISVSDAGCGIAPEVKNKIFEPFFTTKTVEQGTGMGLSVVYGIVTKHGGRVLVDSEVDKGTTFMVCFPADQSSLSGKQPAISESLPVGGGEMILLADDDEIVREQLVRTLQNINYNVISARDGEEAIKLLEGRGKEIDIAVLDVIMPKKSGPEVYERAKELKLDMPVLFYTGQPSDHLPFIPDGIHILSKPYTRFDLLIRIRDLLAGRKRE